jgi:hypothetical protein
MMSVIRWVDLCARSIGQGSIRLVIKNIAFVASTTSDYPHGPWVTCDHRSIAPRQGECYSYLKRISRAFVE